MCEPFFNELSIYPLCVNDQDVDQRINDFVKVLEFCGSFLGYKKVRFDRKAKEIELKKDFLLKDYLANNTTGNSYGALLILNMLQPPYIDDDSEEEIKYATHTAKLVRDGKEIEAEGFACAYYSSGFVVGFASEDYWRQNVSFTVSVIDDATGRSRNHIVYGFCLVEQFSNPDFISWAIDKLPLRFRSSGIDISAKTIDIRDDHGKKELIEFSKKIIKEPYIIEIVNSLPFKVGTRKKTNWVGDGILEIRLVDVKNKIGVAARTTACNDIEAAYLAADIEKKYF